MMNPSAQSIFYSILSSCIRKKKENLMALIILTFFGVYFTSKYNRNAECFNNGKKTQVLVKRKYYSGTRVSKKTLEVSFEDCRTSLEVSDSLFTHTSAGARITLIGFRDKCTFCEPKRPSASDRYVGLAFFCLALIYLINLFFNFLPTWASD